MKYTSQPYLLVNWAPQTWMIIGFVLKRYSLSGPGSRSVPRPITGLPSSLQIHASYPPFLYGIDDYTPTPSFDGAVVSPFIFVRIACIRAIYL